MPDNQQIDETLAYVRDNSPIDVNQLSPEGKKLIQDIRDIVETVSNMYAIDLRIVCLLNECRHALS